jgi:endogenous inhibitor of DNA gyrase (YacG/DUF329 family)
MSKNCANCGKPSSGASVNGRPFCNDPKCIDARRAGLAEEEKP